MEIFNIGTTGSGEHKILHIDYWDDDHNNQVIIRKYDQRAIDAVNAFIADGDSDKLVNELNNKRPESFVTYKEKVADTLNKKFRKLSDHLSTDGVHVYYDNDTFKNVSLDETLEDHIVRIMQNGTDSDLHAVCRFAERLYGNVDERNRADMFKWLVAQKLLTFDDDGRIIGYRGGQLNDDGIAESIHEGYAIVNGQSVNGHVPNPDGAIVEMPRQMVENDSKVACSNGLHVGTYDYARNWARNVIMRVAVAPEDVVSVPYDCAAQKMRCCRFEVIDHENLNTPEYHDTSKWLDNLSYHNSDDYGKYDDTSYYDDDDDDDNVNISDSGYRYTDNDINDTMSFFTDEYQDPGLYWLKIDGYYELATVCCDADDLNDALNDYDNNHGLILEDIYSDNVDSDWSIDYIPFEDITGVEADDFSTDKRYELCEFIESQLPDELGKLVSTYADRMPDITDDLKLYQGVGTYHYHSIDQTAQYGVVDHEANIDSIIKFHIFLFMNCDIDVKNLFHLSAIHEFTFKPDTLVEAPSYNSNDSARANLVDAVNNIRTGSNEPAKIEQPVIGSYVEVRYQPLGTSNILDEEGQVVALYKDCFTIENYDKAYRRTIYYDTVKELNRKH